MASDKPKQKHKGVIRFVLSGYIEYDRADIATVQPGIQKITAAAESILKHADLKGVKLETALSTMPIESS